MLSRRQITTIGCSLSFNCNKRWITIHYTLLFSSKPISIEISYLSINFPAQQKLNEEIMREREEEIRNINRGMHQVNEIYKVRTVRCKCSFFNEKCWGFSSTIGPMLNHRIWRILSDRNKNKSIKLKVRWNNPKQTPNKGWATFKRRMKRRLKLSVQYRSRCAPRSRTRCALGWRSREYQSPPLVE